MNNKGFTLVEILSIIVILSLLIVITVPLLGSVSENIKKGTLKTKVENIEKAAVLYGQKNRENFKTLSNNCPYCKDNDNNAISNCYCYGDNETTPKTITVETLLNPDGDTNTKDALIESDTKDASGNEVITNPLNENEYLNECKIQIYEKYGKIYAVYNKTESTCWYEES